MNLSDFDKLFPGAEIIDLGAIVGDRVLCDLCNKDYSNLPDTGGILVESKAICPDCAPEYERSLVQYGETHLLRYRCPTEKSFAQWVREDLR